MIKKTLVNLFITVIVMMGIQSCTTNYFRSNYKSANSLNHQTVNLLTKPFLKAHLKNGDICILKDSWTIDTTSNVVTGSGTKFDFNRTKVFEGAFSIPIESVAIFETNQKFNTDESGRIAPLTILAGLDVVLGIICVTVPKACFGSCPTFYINENDNFHYSDAEAFSEAIRPSTEYADVDALNNETRFEKTFSITMRNEALETHCVRDLKLLVCPRKIGERVYHSPKDNFYLCENNFAITTAAASEGDITHLLLNQDRIEWFSLSDENNLKSKEEIYLTFKSVNTADDLGLILNFRQTLMTTYLIYSALGYMGDEVGDIFAKMESSHDTRNKVKEGILKELGKIEIFLWNVQKKSWEFQDGFYEIGPIAINRQIIPLENLSAGKDIKLKLVLNKGYWRLDYAALTNIKGKTEPVRLVPDYILNKGIPDPEALKNLINPDKFLVSLPGSEYKFNFTLPDQTDDFELFLYSKGYYLEWIRDNWIKEKNLTKLWQMVNLPNKYLRDEAKNYKHWESNMEKEFWGSKIDPEILSNHEN